MATASALPASGRFAAPSHLPELTFARALFMAARYSDLLEVTDKLPASLESALWRARALYRLGRQAEALDAVTFDSSSNDRAVERATVQSNILGALGRVDEAQRILEQTPQSAVRDAALSERLDFIHAQALLHWCSGAPPKALNTLKAADEDCDPFWAGKFLVLRGWIAASQGRFVEQADLLYRGILAMQQAQEPDLGVIGNALQGLCGVVWELYLEDVTEAAITLAIAFQWPDDLRVQQFQVMRCVSWSYFLRGRYIEGIQHINQTKALAPDQRWMFVTKIDHAYFARMCNEEGTALAELGDAYKLIRAADWNVVTGDEVTALLAAAELFTANDPGRARELLAIYEEAKKKLSTQNGFRHNRRLHALESYTRAAMAHHGGDHKVALSESADAYHTSLLMKHNWRAARAALIAHANGGGHDYLERAAAAIAMYPRSFVAVEVAKKKKLAERPLYRELTPKEQAVFELLCTGASALECAFMLNMSESTMRGHAQKIYRTFRVKSRAQLLIVAARNGLIGPAPL